MRISPRPVVPVQFRHHLNVLIAAATEGKQANRRLRVDE
ncbi:hypothetical protein T261_1519 [Streptomyces lydicus]|nr:hypothetical protein T261_1519 [Streptomyces lydicus]